MQARRRAGQAAYRGKVARKARVRGVTTGWWRRTNLNSDAVEVNVGLVVTRSLQIRKKALEQKKRDAKRLATGKLRPEEISIAAALGDQFRRAPLLVTEQQEFDWGYGD